MNANLRNASDLAGRVLLATLFLVAGFGKLGAYAGTEAYMASKGVPGALLPLVIAPARPFSPRSMVHLLQVSP